MTETQLREKVIKLARDNGALVHYCTRSERCIGAGFPDLVIAGVHGVIFAELKSQTGETDAPQDEWAWTLTQSSIWSREKEIKHVYFLLRPQDLYLGVIEKLIKQVV